MKRSDLILKSGDLRGYSCSRRSPLLKAASLGTVMTALLSSVSPVAATTFSPTEQQTTIQSQQDLKSSKSTDGSGVLSSNVFLGDSEGRNGSIHFSSDQFCGVDDIVVSSTFDSKKIDTGRTITEGNNEELIAGRKFAACQLERPAIWTVDGRNTVLDVFETPVVNNMLRNSSRGELLPNDTEIAIGKVKRVEKDSIAIGADVIAGGGDAIVIGNKAEANAFDGGKRSIVIGYGARAGIRDDTELAIPDNIVIGTEAFSRVSRGVVIGTKASTSWADAVVIGTEASGNGQSSVAIGEKAKAGIDAVAIGKGANSSADAVAIGGKAKAGIEAIAIGKGAETLDKQSVAIGSDASVSGIEAIAIGKGAKTLDKQSVAIGSDASVSGIEAIAIGKSAKTLDKQSVAIGSFSQAVARKNWGGYDPLTDKEKEAGKAGDHIWSATNGMVSIGDNESERSRVLTGVAAGREDYDAVNVAQLKALRQWAGDEIAKAGGSWDLSVNGEDSANISSGSTVDFSSTDNLEISKDEKNKVTFDLAKNITVDSIAVAGHTLDQKGLALRNGPSITISGIDMANRKITGVADGIADSEAVNRKQLNKVEELAKKGWTLTVEDKSINVGAGNTISLRTRSKNLSLVSDNMGNMTLDLAKSITVDNITVGDNILNENGLQIKDGSTVLGPAILVSGISAGNKKITGVLAGTEGTDAVNLSQLNEVKNELEKNNWIQQDSGTGVITIGAKVDGTEINFANKDKKGRTLSGIKDGTLSAASTEAVTGKQLYKVDSELTETTKKVSDVSKTVDGLSTSVSGLSANVKQVEGDVSAIAKNASDYLGGGANVLSGTAPTYKVQGKNYQNVGTAFAGVDVSITDIYSKIASVAGDSLVQQEASEKGDGLITIGSKVGGTEISLMNKDDGSRTLSGLKDGTLSDASTEAVTGKQLYKVDSKLTETTKKVSDVSKTVEGLSTSVSGLSTNVKKVEGDVSAIAKNASEYLGGGADVLSGTAPTYNVQGSAYTNVSSAFAGVDGSITDLYSQIASVAGGSLVEQEASEKGDGLITIGSKVGGTEISLANKDKKGRTLSGLKDGTLSEASTEAVTGKQLYKVDSKLTETTKKVSDVSKTVEGLSTSVSGLSTNVKKVEGDVSAIAKNASDYLGGGADVLVGTAPTYKVQGKNYQNVGTAFAGVDVSITDIYSKIASVAGGSLVEQEASEKGDGLITIGSKVGGTEISLANKDDGGRILSGLKDGMVSGGSTQAVTGNQLYITNSQIASYLGGGASYEDGKWTDPTFTINVLQEDGSMAEKGYKNVADALKDVSSSFTTVVENNLIQQEESEKGDGLITIGSKVGGTEISLANKDKKGRTLSGLKDGTLSEASTEAVTGKQLYKVDNKLTATTGKVDGLSIIMRSVQSNVSAISENTSNYLGGGASVLFGTAPTYNVQGSDYNNVGEAFAGVDSSLSDIYQELSGVGSKSLVQQEASEDGSGLITIGSKVGGTEISLMNKDDEGRTLSGLKDGLVSEDSTEAVTGKQLYGVNSKLTETTGKVDGLSTSMKQVEGDVSKIAKNASNYLGGGADVLVGTAPTYKVQGNAYTNVGSAFAGVDGSITDIYSKIASVAGGSLVEQEASEDDSGRITIGSKVGGTEINLENKDKKGRTLSGLKDGTLSAASTEAVTGKQLYEVDTKLTASVDELSTSMTDVQSNVAAISENTSNYLGGGANVLGGTAPTYNVQGSDYNNVGEAFAGVDSSLSDIYQELSGVGSKSLVQQEASEKGDGLITIGSKVGGTEINLENKDKKGRTLSGLKDGTLSEASTEAVTGKQLYKVDSKLTETTGKVDGLSTSMKQVEGNVSAIAENASNYLGGGANVLDGTAPTYNVQGKNYQNVGTAFAGVDVSITDIYSKIASVAGGSLVEQEASEDDSGRITIGSKVGGTEINLENKDKKGRTLSGLKDGTLSAASTEAVTGKQLYKVDNKLTATTGKVDSLSIIMRSVQSNVSAISENTSNYLGGGASVLFGTAPTYNVQGSDYNNVGEAFAGVDSSLSDIYQELSGVGSKSLVQQEASEKGDGLITIGSKVGGTEINLANKDDEGRTLSGLKDGMVSGGSTQAVTGNQLYITNSQIASYLGGGASYEDGKWTDPTFTINVLQEDGSTGEKEYKNVADALKDVSSSFTTVVENNLIQQEESEDGDGRITIGAQVGGTEISLENKDKKGRTLSGLKDGTLSAASTEAVTGKQLYEVDTKLTASVDELSTSMTDVQSNVSAISENTSNYLGGGADVLGGTAPTYNVQGSDYNNVGEAFAGVDSSLSDIYQELSGVGSKSLVQQEASEKGDGRITIGAQVGGTEISLENKDKKGRTLSGLKDGMVSGGSTQAVTGNQLYITNSQIASYLGGGAGYEDGKWTDPTFTINVLQEDGSTGEKEYKNVADALKDISSSFTTVVENNLIQQEESEDGDGRITIGAQVGGTEISLANKDKKGRTLSGLKDGTLSETSNEAVTGKQLYEVDTKLTASVDELSTSMTDVQSDLSVIAKNASDYLGGGANVLGGTAPTYNVQGSDYNNVGEAFAGVDSSLSDIYQELSGVGSKSLVQQEASEKGDGRITIGSKVGGTEINLANKDDGGRTLSGLKDGMVSGGSTQAVTGNQLYITNSQIASYLGGGASYEDGKWTDPTFTINVLEEDGSTGEKEYKNVADALKDISSSFTTVVENNLIQQEESEKGDGRITIGAQVGGTEISLANKDKKGRTLSGLKDGAVSEASTEAVTGKQLYEVDTKLTASVDELSTSMTNVQSNLSVIAKNASDYLGGGANVLDGTAPTYKVQGIDYQNVGTAFAGIDTTLTQLLNETSENTENLQNSLLWDEKEGAFVALHGEKGQEKVKSKLKFLDDGDIAEGSTEAITGSQLYATNSTLASYFGGGAEYGANGWVAPTFEVIQFNFGGKAGEQKYDTYNNVADAFGGVNKSMESLNNRIDSVENQAEQNGLNWNEGKGAYDASRKDEEGNLDSSKITGVKDGDISKGSSDVVTGNQLWETNNKVDGLKNDVDDLKNKVDGFEDAVGQMAEGAVQYDKDEDGKKTNKITLAGGDASAPVVIDNIGDGKVEKGSKEAINGGQLYEKMEIVLDDAKKYTDEKMKDAVSEAKDYTDMKFDSLNYNIEGVKKEARQAAAIGLAVSSLRYEDAPGALSVAFSSGSWRSQSAIAFGAGYTSEDGNIRSNISVTTAGGHWGVGAGLSLRLK
ncbi:Vomp family autotransporter [Bartonella sp. C271]|uniref:Vomp family autotransporter n=1 Tax=Bartonella sp. C271 TaxID=3070220 RepID=UPI003D8157D8